MFVMKLKNPNIGFHTRGTQASSRWSESAPYSACPPVGQGRYMKTDEAMRCRPRPQVDFGQPLSLHVVGADHHLVDVLDAVVHVVEAQLAVQTRERQVGVEEVDVVMVGGAVARPKMPKPFWMSAEPEAQPVTIERP